MLYDVELSAMRLRCHDWQINRLRGNAFTIVEALVALVVLMVFALTSTMSLNFFNERAARNRNAEAARAVVEDYVNRLLNDTGGTYAATLPGADLDGDGTPDGVPCPTIAGVAVPTTIPLVVSRTATADAVVSGSLYCRIQALGTTYGCTADTDLLRVDFLLQYTFHSQTYYYKATTFKANSNS